jgi:hypothetical protein
MTWQTPSRSCIESLRHPDRPESRAKDDALSFLRRISGLDFGDDIAAWEDWAKANKQWDLQDNWIEKNSQAE